MTIYVPLVVFDIPDEDKQICDYVLHGFLKEEDAKMVHPDADILEVQVGDTNYLNN